eukprot:gene11110-biopygen12825
MPQRSCCPNAIPNAPAQALGAEVEPVRLVGVAARRGAAGRGGDVHRQNRQRRQPLRFWKTWAQVISPESVQWEQWEQYIDFVECTGMRPHLPLRPPRRGRVRNGRLARPWARSLSTTAWGVREGVGGLRCPRFNTIPGEGRLLGPRTAAFSQTGPQEVVRKRDAGLRPDPSGSQPLADSRPAFEPVGKKIP